MILKVTVDLQMPEKTVNVVVVLSSALPTYVPPVFRRETVSFNALFESLLSQNSRILCGLSMLHILSREIMEGIALCLVHCFARRIRV